MRILLSLAAALAFPMWAQFEEQVGDVPYVPTPPEVVEQMMKLGQVKPGDVIYDLGCGDGRLVITAIKKHGAVRGVGIDINPVRVKEANENAAKEGVSAKAKFIEQDLFKADFSEATVVTLYLLPEVNLRLKPILLKQLKPGTRIVSHQFDMGEWKPEKTVEIEWRRVHMWTVPPKGTVVK